MEYCVNYRKGFKYLKEVDELTIRFSEKDTTLVDFLLLYKNKRINISILSPPEIENFIEHNSINIFNAIKVKYPDLNIAFLLGSCDEKMIKLLKENNYKFFFTIHANDWDTLYGLVQLQPSDIYIVENLGFELDKVSNLLHKNNIKVRTFLNVAQSSWKNVPSLKKFFIRPDDIDIYSKYVDIGEFFGKDNSIETYYKIYAIDKKWTGPLNEVIIDFKDSEIDSRYITPLFAERRIKCGKRCFKGSGCRVCEAISDLSFVLKDHNIIFKDKRR